MTTASHRTTLHCLLLALAYLVAGKLGLMLAIPPGFATAIFPPAGIALAALLLYGNRLWPGALIGSTSMNLWISLGAGAPFAPGVLIVALCIGLGATVQAVVGATLIRRFVGAPYRLDNERDVLIFLGLGGPLSCLINSSIGPATLWAAGIINTPELLYSAWTWWVGDSIGVLIATPLMFIALAEPQDVWSARRRTVAIPLLFTCMVVVTLFVRASDWETDRLQNRFNALADEITDNLQLTLAQHLSILDSLERFYASSQQVDREEFKTFVTPSLLKIPGLQAVTWTPRVSAAERAAFEAEAQQISPSLQIFERNPEGRRMRAPARDEYYPVQYIEPHSGNETALGFDTASNIIARAAQTHARDTGKAAATAPLTLIQEHGTQQGVVVYMPIYRNSVALNSTADRRTHLLGFASLVFRVDDLVNRGLAGYTSQGFALKITDVTNATHPLPLFSHGTSLHKKSGLVHWEKTIKVGSRQWRLAYTSLAISTDDQVWMAWFVLAAGLLFTALLGAFLLVVTGHTAKIEHLVLERTEDLAHASAAATASNRLLAAISQSQARFITSENTQQLFDTLLADLLAITNSEYGFIGEVLYHEDHTPYLKTRAITNIAWNEETRRFYAENAPNGMEFTNLDTLFGHVIRSGEAVIANQPNTDPRRGGLPEGHPPLQAFLGMPFFKGERMIGMIGIANRPGGYDQDLLDYLQPLLHTLANLLDAQRLEHARSTSEQALRESESRLRSIFENAIEAIITFDTRGTIRSINPAGEHLFGYTIQELIDHPWHYLLPMDAQQDFQDAFARYLECGTDELIGSTREMEGVRSDGTHIPIEVAISAVRTESGLLFTAIVHDLTERRRVDRMKNEFISTVSHELRTPLTSILGNLSLINGGALGDVPANLQAQIDSAHRNAKRLLNLINDILDIEKIESGQLSIKPKIQPLLPLIIQAIDGNRGYADGFGVNLMLAQPTLTECCAKVDADRLIQIMNNLISNAIKFSPKGETVEVRLTCQHNQAQILIRDHGPGIPESFQSQIFQKFAQADASDTRQYAGTGLGLNITRALVQKMHGHISFSCPTDGGTEFQVSLPTLALPYDNQDQRNIN